VTNPSEITVTAAADLKLILEIRNGDRQKYQQVVERYQQTISRRMWKFSRVPNEHQELVQEVFVEAYLSLRNFRGESPFEHWLQKIATRVGYRFWKKKRRSRETDMEQIQQAAATLDDGRELAAAEAAAVVYRLLGRLSTEDRLVMTLLHLEEYSVAEIAQQMNWSESNVKVRAHRARKKLTEWLREDERD
jgi:RNA polymerase sigma-70 factor (ECF subfamily)